MPKALKVIFAVMLFALSVAPALAQEYTPPMLEQLLEENAEVIEIKDGSLRLTSNKNAFIKLNQDAYSVVVNNPAHASVMLDTPRLLIVVPHAPGTTSFTVLGRDGETIMQKDIIVTNVQKKYVRIRRMCDPNDQTCAANSYFYCPDGCYQVTPVQSEENRGNAPALRPNTNTGMMPGSAIPPIGFQPPTVTLTEE